MAKVFVFCIGGTGLRVMKSVVMLAASGMKTNGYDIVPVILDPHVELEEKTVLTTTIGDYIKVYKNATSAGSAQQLDAPAGFFNTKIVRLEDLDNQQNSTSANMSEKKSFGQYLNVGALPNDDVNNYLIQTLYSKDNLKNSLSVGFKGNPNVGTVVLNEMISGADWYEAFQRHCEKDDRVFIISSIFGGTGASGYPLLEKKIRSAESQPAVKNALMGAVTVLPYYGLKDPSTTGSDIDSANFYTKTKAALAYYEKTVKSNYLYYAGETSLIQVYENDEKKQDDKAHFIELVAASALFDFLYREEPETQQFLTRAIEDAKNSLDIISLGSGYKDIVKCVADYKLLSALIDILPKEAFFPLKKNRGFDETFYKDAAFKALKRFSDIYDNWYQELSTNKRAFAPLNTENLKKMEGWVKNVSLDAKDDSYYLLKMIQTSNANKSKDHDNKFRFFLQFAHEAIEYYTKKILK